MRLLATVLLLAFVTLITTDGFLCASDCCKDSGSASAGCECNIAGVCVLCGTAYVPAAPHAAPAQVSVVAFAAVPAFDAPIAAELPSVYHPPRFS